MLKQLESDYDCANASADLMDIQQSLEQLEAKSERTEQEQQELNRLHNQAHFIKNKCDIVKG
jgi:uncharacterized protein involved in exopolysaccharide biosynthesis